MMCPYRSIIIYKRRNKVGKEKRINSVGCLGAAGSHMIDCLTWLLQDDVPSGKWFIAYSIIPNGAGKISEMQMMHFLFMAR